MPAYDESAHTDLLPLGPDETPYRLLTSEGVSVERALGRDFLSVAPEALTLLARDGHARHRHLLRPGHLAQLRRILDDPEASANDRFVALDLLKNAAIAAGGVLPMCQDTGTAIVMGKRGQTVLTDGHDEAHLSAGIRAAYTELNLRYSQLAPLTMWEEKNTGTNLPAQIELYASAYDSYDFLFMAKGGGSANKSFLFQETKAVLNATAMMRFLEEKIRSLGTAACPPYHLAIVVGGTSAEFALKTAKYASAKYLDALPTSGSASGHGFRDLDLELQVHELTRRLGIGAQFGGKYFCHDVRVVRLPRHGASCPVAIAVSCSADRQARAQDHRRGRVPRGARDRPRAVPARGDDEDARRRRRPHRPEPADERDPRDAVAAAGEDPGVADRPARRRPRHRPRQDRLDPRRGRRDAAVPARHARLLRRPGQDARGLRLRLVRPDDGRPHGLLRRPLPGRRRLAGHARQGQPQLAGHRRLQGARRLLPRLDRRPGGPARAGLHPQGRGARVPRARHGGGLADRGRGLPGVRRRRRQGQRLLHRPRRGRRRPDPRDDRRRPGA